MTTQPKGRRATRAQGRAQTRAKARPLTLEGCAEWLVERGLKGLPIDEQIGGFCDRIHAAGFPMRRANLGIGTLHPQYGALTYVWRPGRGVERIARQRGLLGQEIYTKSPVYHMRTHGLDRLRRRLDTGEPAEFMVFEELRAQGLTDYAARTVGFGTQAANIERLDGVFFSCATDLSEGFDDDQLEQVAATLPYLALAVKSRSTYDVARTVLETYLGRDAGHRVLTGEIMRGTVETIRAVLWLCDLRDFTALADTLPREALVELLDGYFDVMAGPVHSNGGEILKFLGDGFLAIFNLATLESEAVCANALKAAAELREGFAVYNGEREAAGKPTLHFGLALHMGEVLYGNIGALDRLDFTVVGPAVNEVSRIENQCKPLEQDVLVSKAFHTSATHCRARLVSIGKHKLRGVREPQELFTLGG
jgi:adenylate cyclase